MEQVEKTYKMVKNKSSDSNQFESYKNRLQKSPYLPKKLEDFTKMKYNNISSYKQLNREYRTIGKINKTSSDVNRDVDMYYQFRKDNIEMTDHSLQHYFDRMYDKKNNLNYDYNKIVETFNKKANYEDTNGRKICYYDGIVIVKEVGTDEMVTLRKGRVSNRWKKI